MLSDYKLAAKHPFSDVVTDLIGQKWAHWFWDRSRLFDHSAVHQQLDHQGCPNFYVVVT
jgi:hypothetical protein